MYKYICIAYNLRETGYECLEWIYREQNSRQWRNVVNGEVNLRFPYKAENLLSD